MPTPKKSPAQNAKKPPKASTKPPAKAAPKAKPAASTWRAAPASTQAPDTPEERRPLTPSQQLFVEEYLVDLNATQAAIRAGYSAHTANAQGGRLMMNVSVRFAIDEGKRLRSEKTGITAEKALAQAWAVATADARELVEFIVGCCRHCYGENFKFQRTLGEYNKEREAWQLKTDAGDTTEPWDEKGGIGFDPRLDPHPGCPECFGKGQGRAHINDTRKLSPAGVALYAGVKTTKDGQEVKMHSKLDALEKVFKHLGLYEQDNRQKVDPLSTLLATMARSSVPVVKDVDHD